MIPVARVTNELTIGTSSNPYPVVHKAMVRNVLRDGVLPCGFILLIGLCHAVSLSIIKPFRGALP
jgi:hypothetical protein